METREKHEARMTRTDGCPECVDRGHLPHFVADDGTGQGFYALYVCPRRHNWWTSWSDTMINFDGWSF